MTAAAPPRLEIRNARPDDVAGIVALSARVYTDEPPYVPGQIRGQINAFGKGCFVAIYDGAVVGYAASIRVIEARVMQSHTWSGITGAGYASQHNAAGDWLYGMEVMVDPARRRLRLGRRLYQARERLCVDLDLKGIAFGARIPGFRRQKAKYATPQAYLAAVREGDLHDPVLDFQIRAGFNPVMALPGYAPDDVTSGGHAVLMIWHNPYYSDEPDQPVTRADPEVVRVAAVQMKVRTLTDPKEFYQRIDHFVDIAADYGADFVLFPEHFTLQLLSCEDEELPPMEAIEHASRHTATFVERLQAMAIARAINIVAGSHATRTETGEIQNVAHVFLRDGSVHRQEKLHPTPDERASWNILGGTSVDVIDTDCGPIGVLICYDSEFPEAARRLADQGAAIIFVPYCTDTRHGHLRVRYCSAARAVENQCYVVTAGMVGRLDNVSNIDIQYAQSAILTPCDFPFARDGIAAEASENVEMVIVADLNLASIRWARAQGSVRNLRDRRFDLYRTRWADGG